MSDHAPSLPHLRGHHGHFEAFCALMQQTAAGRFGPVWWGVWQQYIAPSLPDDGHVVDFGCGPGGFFASLRAHHPRVRLTGVEIQPAMLLAARELAQKLGAEVVEADLTQPPPLPDATADAAAAVMVLHEMPDPLPALREMRRVLKPGGALLLYDWTRQPLRTYLEGRVLDAEILQHFREHCLYTSDDLAFLAQNAGFEVQEVIGRKDNGYAMLALRRPA